MLSKKEKRILNPAKCVLPLWDFLFWKKRLLWRLFSKKTEIEQIHDGYNGHLKIHLFFDPMEFTTKINKKITDTYTECFGRRMLYEMKRVGKLYSLCFECYHDFDPFFQVSEIKNYIKELHLISENQAKALLNIKSDDVLIRFISMLVVQINEVGI